MLGPWPPPLLKAARKVMSVGGEATKHA